jgi:hypothetical protein
MFTRRSEDRMKRTVIGLAATVLAVGVGCAKDPTESLSEGVGGISTSLSYVEIVVGDSVVVIAETKDNQGVTTAELPTIASQTPSIVSTSDAYLPPLPIQRFYIKALAYGEGEIAATAGGQTATILVQTLPATVEISGAPDTLGSGASAQLTAIPLDRGGSPLTMDDTLFTWSASPASAVVVNASGLATAQAPGTATVTVEGPGGVINTASVVVVAGTFAGTLSAATETPGVLVTATKAAAGPDFDADSKAVLDGTPAWVEAVTATTLTFAVPATGSTAAGALTLSDMGPNQLAQKTAFTPASAVDAWSPGNITDDCSAPAAAADYNTEKSATGWLYFSHHGTGQGDRGCQNGGSGFDHYFAYTTGGSAESVEIRTEWKLSGDNDLYVCTADLSDCGVATGFSGESFNEVISGANLAANTTYLIVFSPWTGAAGGNAVRLRIQ